MWTRETPTQEGWYWVRTPLWPKPEIRQIVKSNSGEMHIHSYGFLYVLETWAAIDIEFYSTPIAEPEEQ